MSASIASHASGRRSDFAVGCVQFPVESDQYRSTKEGGMVVKLVVVDDREYDESPWTTCSGAYVVDILSETLVNDDKCPRPVETANFDAADHPDFSAALTADQEAHRAWAQTHYPALHEQNVCALSREISRPYLATVVMGATGWSGATEKGDLWHCTYEDLTEPGKQIYAALSAQFPGCSLHLLTFLDT